MGAIVSRMFVLGALGLGVLFVVTPATAAYALDYRVTVSPLETATDDATAFESLDPDVRAALENVDDGQWYRSRGDAPDAFPVIYERNGTVYLASLENQYHWESWRGKLPFLTAAVSLVCLAVVTRNQLRNMQGTDNF